MRVSKIENLQMAEQSRGLLKFWPVSDQKDRSDASCLMNFDRTNETNEKFPKNSKITEKKIEKKIKIDIADVIKN